MSAPRAATVLALAAVVFAGSPRTARAQTEEDPSALWATFGLGGSIWAGGNGLNSVGGLTYRGGPHLISLRGSWLADFSGSGLVDLGLLYGRGTRGTGWPGLDLRWACVPLQGPVLGCVPRTLSLTT